VPDEDALTRDRGRTIRRPPGLDVTWFDAAPDPTQWPPVAGTPADAVTTGPGSPLGARSLRLTADAVASVRRGRLHQASSGRSPALGLRLSDADRLAALTVRFESDFGSWTWRIVPDPLGLPDRPPTLCSGQWTTSTLSFADAAVTGQPDRGWSAPCSSPWRSPPASDR
jgi:hypothetical protein